MPMPMRPFGAMRKSGDEVPASATTKVGVLVACCSIEKSPHGVVEPMPTPRFFTPPEPLERPKSVRSGVPSICAE